jgi:hypothetical protein
LRGGLLRGGTGVEAADQHRSKVRDVLHAAEVPGVRSRQGGYLPSDGTSKGDGAEAPPRG